MVAWLKRVESKCVLFVLRMLCCLCSLFVLGMLSAASAGANAPRGIQNAGSPTSDAERNKEAEAEQARQHHPPPQHPGVSVCMRILVCMARTVPQPPP